MARPSWVPKLDVVSAAMNKKPQYVLYTTTLGVYGTRHMDLI